MLSAISDIKLSSKLHQKQLLIAVRTMILITVLTSQISTRSLAQNAGCDSTYAMVDEAPMFKNGYNEFAFYINNLDFGNCEITDTVTLAWTVDRSGQMIDIDVAGLKEECKDRVIGQLAKFPKWTPAKVNSIPVCFKMKVRKDVTNTR
jgi:hypothetical protein